MEKQGVRFRIKSGMTEMVFIKHKQTGVTGYYIICAENEWQVIKLES